MKKKKPDTPKPWRYRVEHRQFETYIEHCDWSDGDWQRYHAARRAKRRKPMRPLLKCHRLEDQAIERARLARSQRMKDYHARRRAALAAETAERKSR